MADDKQSNVSLTTFWTAIIPLIFMGLAQLITTWQQGNARSSDRQDTKAEINKVIEGQVVTHEAIQTAAVKAEEAATTAKQAVTSAANVAEKVEAIHETTASIAKKVDAAP